MLRFEKKLDVTPDNLEDLSEIQRAQLFDAYPKWFGKEPPSIEAMFLDADGKAGIALCEFYQVYESDDATEPKYDVWIVNVDTGSVYESGTTLDTGIGMIQNYFQQIESDDKELAHELHSAFVRYVQQTRRQKPAETLEEEDDERAIADMLAQEMVNGRSEEDRFATSPIASRPLEATTPQATSKPRKKSAAAAAKPRVKTSARTARSRKSSPAKSAKKTATAKTKAKSAKKTATANTKAKSVKKAEPANVKKKVAAKPGAKKATPKSKVGAKRGATKATSNAKSASANKKNATASKATKK